MHQVNERSSNVVTLRFRNLLGELQAPLSVTYRIDDLDSKQQLRAWTAATPAAEAEIPIDAEENRILDDGLKVETRVLTYVASYGASPADQITGEARWAVKNLPFLS